MHYHPFLPRSWSSAAVLKWLKRVHAWTGLWGALSFLLLGFSGFLLNHRAQWKIDTGEPAEVSSVELPVVPGTIPDAEALGGWAQNALRLPVKGQPPRAGADGAPVAKGTFMGHPVRRAKTWSRTFNLTDARVIVSYVEGANHVTAKREDIGFLNILKNLHKGVGLPVAWVLLMDTIAGALVAMSLTGVLLWSRLHGPRLLAVGLAGGSLVWALIAAGST